MKAKLKARIGAVTKTGGDVILSLNTPTAGKVDTKALNAKEIFLTGEVRMRQLVADDIKIGAVITITLTDEDADERVE